MALHPQAWVWGSGYSVHSRWAELQPWDVRQPSSCKHIPGGLHNPNQPQFLVSALLKPKCAEHPQWLFVSPVSCLSPAG